jgi:hypothetical protein
MLRKGNEAFRDKSVGLKSPRRCRKNWKKGRALNSFLVEYYVFSGMRDWYADESKCFDTIVMVVVLL